MDILDYIKGKLKGKAANEFEKESQGDPFLSDAIEGYNSVEGNHIQNLSNLKDKIAETKSHRYRHRGKRKRINVVHIIITLILLGICVLSVRIFEDKNQQKFKFTNSYYIDSINYINNDVNDFPKPEKGNIAYNRYLLDGINVFLESRGKVMGDYVEICFMVSTNGNPYNIELAHGVYTDLDGYIIELISRGDKWTRSDKRTCLRIVFE